MPECNWNVSRMAVFLAELSRNVSGMQVECKKNCPCGQITYCECVGWSCVKHATNIRGMSRVNSKNF